MVRPNLEYGDSIWDPRFRRDKVDVDEIQRRATELIPELKSLLYLDQLTTLSLPALKYRRRRGDMLQVFQIVDGIDRVNPSTFFSMNTEFKTRSHDQKFRKRECNARYPLVCLHSESGK